MTRRTKLLLIGVGALLLLTGCAAEPNPAVDTGSDPDGFLMGLWHGLILPVTFVISLFNDDVFIYEVRNTGHLYDLGFVLGAGGLSLPGFLSKNRK